MSRLLNQPPHPGKILCFGEMMLRISPDAEGDWLNSSPLPLYLAGAELNVANALALWGLASKYLSALPNNWLSAQIIKYLQNKGVDTSAIINCGERMGVYYLTRGKDIKHDALLYDRANSAFAGLKTGIIDWDKALQGVSWFHFSAICPAISQNIADVCKEALEAAEKNGITVSVDLNYRAKLWQFGKLPEQVMPGLVKYCDLVMGNIWAAKTMLGIAMIPRIDKSLQKNIYLKQSFKTSQSIMEEFPKCKAVANTFRFDAANDVKYNATLYIENKFYKSAEYEASHVTDSVGSGDCFMAGLIYGFYNNLDAQQTLEFATAAAFEKLFVNGDAINKTVEEIKMRYTQTKK